MLCCTRLLSNQQKDRGYAWVVVFLAFCCHTVVWGLSYTIGIWTSTFEEAFGASKAVTSTIGSGLTGINYIAGQNLKKNLGFQDCCLIIWIFQVCLEACFVSTMATEKSSWLEL